MVLIKLKSWQLFFYFFLPIILDSLIPIDKFAFVHEILKVGFIANYLIWLYKLGIFFFNKTKGISILKLKWFRLNFIIVIMYLIGLYILINVSHYNIENFGFVEKIIVMVHIYCAFAILYLFYFVSKSIVTFEINEIAKPNKFLGIFFMLWFYPIGLWFLQPRIRKLRESTTK